LFIKATYRCSGLLKGRIGKEIIPRRKNQIVEEKGIAAGFGE